MPLKNTPAAYGTLSKSLHWIMALLIVVMLAVGFVMGDITPLLTKLRIYDLHKSTGILILALAAFRVGWHLLSRRPALDPSMKIWEKWAAHTVHYALYAAMFAMPISGWLMSSAAGRPVSFFGLFTLPDLISKDDNLRHFFNEAHELIAFALIAAIAAHAGAALKHHFISKDNTLRRMLPVFILLCLASPAFAKPASWQMIPEESKLSFSGKQMGNDFSGVFKNFTPVIHFSPDHLAESSVEVSIDLSSVDSADSERDSAVKGDGWFEISRFPTATFAAKKFTRKSESEFIAEGTLSLRDKKLPLSLPFSLAFSKDDSGKEKAVMQGTATLNRADFGLGGGEWADTSVIANEIAVTVTLAAVRAD